MDIPGSAEKKRTANTQPFPFQTYMRDSGEILNDLSIPVFVGGKRWGHLVVGIVTDKLLQD
jgi:methyl-accepting chemotaxis protein